MDEIVQIFWGTFKAAPTIIQLAFLFVLLFIWWTKMKKQNKKDVKQVNDVEDNRVVRVKECHRNIEELKSTMKESVAGVKDDIKSIDEKVCILLEAAIKKN